MKFVGPMLGFEGANQYALLDVSPQSPFKIMQLVGNPDVSFLVTDPAPFFPEYQVDLSKEQLSDIGLEDPSKAALMVVVNIRGGGKQLTANLLGPVVVNVENFQGKQIVLKASGYRSDEPLSLERSAPTA
jgi:flagellar assembly factor FliW